MIKTILVPTDGSGHAKKAVDLAAEIAEKYGARLVILHVLLRHTGLAPFWWTVQKDPIDCSSKSFGLMLPR